jgi:tetratricopeptide (TPR) repeat protein
MSNPGNSGTSMPAIVDSSFPDSSDDDVDEPAAPPRSSLSLASAPRDPAPNHTEEGDIDLTSTPSSFSPSSFEAYRHQLQHSSGNGPSSSHNAISFSRGDKLGSSLAVDIEPRTASSQGSAIGASARSITSLMQQQAAEQSSSSRPTPSIQTSETAAHQHILALFDGVLTERAVDAVDSRHVLERIVRSDSMKDEHTLFRHLVQTLVQSDRLERALTMAENCLPTGAPDDLILALLSKLDSSQTDATQLEQSWQLILRLRDKIHATPKAAFQHYRSWDLSRAIDMFFMCERHLSKKIKSLPADKPTTEADSLKSELSKVQETHRRLVSYRDAFNKFQQSSPEQAEDDVPMSPSSKSRAMSSHNRTIVLDTLASQRWQKLDQLCEQDLAGVINALTDSDHYEVARKLADHFRATALKVKIEERYLLHLLSSETDTRTVRERLLSLEKLEAIRVAESLLESVSTNEHRLFLIQFLMERKSDDGGLSGILANGAGSLGSLSTKELGVKILLRLPVELQSAYQNRINKPMLIVESLFMSEQTAVLSSVLKDIPQIRNDAVVLTYAMKALDTTRLTTPVMMSFEPVDSPRSSSASSVPASPMKRSASNISVGSGNLPVALSASASLSLFSDETSIDSVREQHTFTSAPNHQLATAFLDLCSSARVAAAKCIEISDALSNRLQSFRDRLEVVRIIQQLLVYAKLRLMKEFDSAIDVAEQPLSPREEPPVPSPRSSHTSQASPFTSSSSFAGALQSASTPALVSLCDTLLSRIELLQQLLFSAPDVFQSQSLSLSVFADPTKIRQLRDKLLEQDRLDTALLVAAKCSIESEPVWAAKALQMLQSGRYQEAKQLFKYCLVSSRDDDDPPPPMVTMSRAAVGLSVAPNRSPTDNGPLLQKILRVLESGAPLDANDLRRHYSDIVGRVTTQPAFVKKLANYSESGVDSMKLFQSLGKKLSPSATGKRKHTLDSLRYMQCIYYLQRYGSSEDLIQFWLRHGLIEDAMRHVVSNHLDSRLFNIIVMHAVSHNLLGRIKEWVAKQESTSPKSSHEFILATCKHLNSAEMFKLLLEFQLMMKDYVRAGLTCVKIFNRIPPLDFPNRLNYLNMAKKYFQQGLEDGTSQDVPAPAPSSSSAVPTSPLASKSDISKYVRTANLQIRVTTFFQQSAKLTPAPESLPPNISLFQNAQRRAMLAEALLTLHNFDLAFAIVQEYRLPTQKIYQSALVSMALKQQAKKIDELLKMVKPWLSETEWDEIILAVVRVYMETHNDASNADNFASKLRAEQNKIEALILMRKLKQAYLSAVKMNSVELVQRIQEEAKRLDMRREFELCEKFLQSRVQN